MSSTRAGLCGLSEFGRGGGGGGGKVPHKKKKQRSIFKDTWRALKCIEHRCRVLRTKRGGEEKCSASCMHTRWRRPKRCLKLEVIFRKRATNYRALLWKINYEDTASYGSSPPCTKYAQDMVRVKSSVDGRVT